MHLTPLIQPDAAATLEQLRSALSAYVFVFLSLGFLLTVLVSRNLTSPFNEIVQTLKGVKNGRFDKKIQVTSNDEIGYTGDIINEMTDGLLEREKMQHSLHLAREVQQNLLPKVDLKVNGFDIAGKSVYCDETGGDYYDFIDIGDPCGHKIGVAIGDVSGHGISSALLMATVRSSLRQRASLPGSIANIVSDVNRQLAQDVEDSGQFMTMFFLALNTESKHLEWVRAGHDPAIIYDPGSDSFNELGGAGIALGIDRQWVYDYVEKSDLRTGQIIFLSTDGVWEVLNKEGEMLGKKPILNAIRQNSSKVAKQIIDEIFDILDTFREGAKIEDDITSVVIKVQEINLR
jgi:sigma-B regulation protein RsbU (phosphoserine phosphatase)